MPRNLFMAVPGRHSATLAALLVAGCAASAIAHPVPDVPVRAYFTSAPRQASFEIEIDLRCFADDPENEPYYIHSQLQSVDDARRAELKAPALEFLTRTMRLVLASESEGGGGIADPEFVLGFDDFAIEFGKVGGGELEAADDPVALVVSGKSPLAEGIIGYRLEALEAGMLSVLFINHLDGLRQKRMQVLFPGENSKVLDLRNIAADAKAGAAPEPAAPALVPASEEKPSAEVGDDAETPTWADAEPEGAMVGNRKRESVAMVGGIVVAALAGLAWMVGRR